MARFAADKGTDGIICGHIHTAAIRTIGTLDYYNTGDWVESRTALVEEENGDLRLLQFSSSGELTATLATCGHLKAPGDGAVDSKPAGSPTQPAFT